MLLIQRISTIEELEELADDWDSLLVTAQIENIFLTYSWIIEWWQVYGADADIWVLISRQSDQIIGIAPLMIRKRAWGIRYLSFIGSGEVFPNHLEFIVRPDMLTTLVQDFCEYILQNRSQWDILDFEGLSENSNLALYQDIFRRIRLKVEIEQYATCPYAKFPDSFEMYLDSRGKRTRKNFRKYSRRLFHDHPNVLFGRVYSQEELKTTFAALVDFHQDRWIRLGESGAFSSSNFTEFHFAAAQNGLELGTLRMYYIKINSKLIAVDLCYRVGRRVFDYISGFDEEWENYSVGILVMAYAIEQSIVEGAHEFDLLQGDESYKRHWAIQNRNNWRWRVPSPHLRGRVIWAMLKTIEIGRVLGHKVVSPKFRKKIKRFFSM